MGVLFALSRAKEALITLCQDDKQIIDDGPPAFHTAHRYTCTYTHTPFTVPLAGAGMTKATSKTC